METDQDPTPPSDAEAFRAQLAGLGMTMADLVRSMIHYGDNRNAVAIRRALQRVASGVSRFSGALRALTGMLAALKALRARPVTQSN